MNKKTLVGFALVVGFAVAIVLSQLAMAVPDPKVTICHTTGPDHDCGGAKNPCTGHVIVVSANALEAHCSHGDSNVFSEGAAGDCTFSKKACKKGPKK